MDNMGKYRGQKLGTKEWVCGFYLEDDFGRCVIRTIYKHYKEDFIVNPKTVGQFTGETDKNGKAIYVGNKITAECKGSMCYMDNTMVVEFNNCRFGGVDIEYLKHKDRLDFFHRFENMDNIEVIGTIHDEMTE